MEPTRLISPSSLPSKQKQPAPISHAFDGMMRLSQDGEREMVSGGDNDAAQRFTGDVKYVFHFANQLLRTLEMRRLIFGIIEDREGQTAFAQPESINGDWNGFSSSNRRSLKQIREQLLPR